jgi:hypothetical protein
MQAAMPTHLVHCLAKPGGWLFIAVGGTTTPGLRHRCGVGTRLSAPLLRVAASFCNCRSARCTTSIARTGSTPLPINCSISSSRSPPLRKYWMAYSSSGSTPNVLCSFICSPPDNRPSIYESLLQLVFLAAWLLVTHLMATASRQKLLHHSVDRYAIACLHRLHLIYFM